MVLRASAEIAGLNLDFRALVDRKVSIGVADGDLISSAGTDGQEPPAGGERPGDHPSCDPARRGLRRRRAAPTEFD